MLKEYKEMTTEECTKSMQMLPLKKLLSVREASIFFGINLKKMRTFINAHPELGVQNGHKQLVDREAVERYLDENRRI